jgi:hypothetical protein
MKRRHSPHRFGRQSRVNEHPREIGEPSARVIEREARKTTAMKLPNAPLSALANPPFPLAR